MRFPPGLGGDFALRRLPEKQPEDEDHGDGHADEPQ
jgi:hypothetical protein